MPTDQFLAETLQQALSTCWEGGGADHPKPQRELQKVTPPSANHGLAAQVSFENDFKGLASSGPQLTLFFERRENDPSAPIETWQKNLQNRQPQE